MDGHRRPPHSGGDVLSGHAPRTAGLAALALTALCASEAAARVTVPAGFRVTTVATDMGRPSNLAFGRRGSLWTTSAGYSVASSDGVWTKRRGARARQVVRELDTALGLCWFRGELYVSHRIRPGGRLYGRVTAFAGFDGRRFRRRRVVLDRLPVGLHNVDSIVAGPGGRLYVGVGSTRNARRGPSRLSASILSFLPSGRGLRVEARGLRNPYGLAFVPGTRDLLITDNGRDDLGPSRPPEEVNLLRLARRRTASPWFGFPACWGQGGRACRNARPALARLPAHAAATGIAIARRLGRYGLSAYVAQNGSSSESPSTGNDVVRIALHRRRGGGYRATVHRFADGFTRHDPLGAGIGPDGALYVTMWRTGRILRFAPR